MSKQHLEDLGIRAADDASAMTLARLAAGEVSTGLVIFTGPPESKAREAAVTVAFPPAAASEELAEGAAFSSSYASADREVEVIHLAGMKEGDEADLAESIGQAVEQAKPKLLVIVGEPEALPAEAEAVALRVRLDPAAELQAAS